MTREEAEVKPSAVRDAGQDVVGKSAAASPSPRSKYSLYVKNEQSSWYHCFLAYPLLQ